MKTKLMLLLAFVFIGTGCAMTPPDPIALTTDFYEKPAKVAIYQKSFPENARMTMPGASCLLCLAAAAVANDAVSGHTKTLSTEELSSAVKRIETTLEEQGMVVDWVDIEEPMTRLPKFTSTEESGYPKKDYRALKQVVEADHLLVIEFSHIGVERLYANYVPTSSPQGAVTGELYMVDLSTNEYYLLDPIHIRVPVEGEWNEPPEYPGLTMAYFEALERAKIQISDAITGEAPVEVAGGNP
ncbi:hypothetical protein OOT55_13570 [Marinimicrobium sp. C6131]|uniref:hypothetical protein n=1 Tax=Marinimicrobium sp. C6131 TaxID=3022676 RepID=UPI00223E509A|nr:hypothetical protein [Marinimicrobium sp. C6131]UZJ43679.1 hypothetical protein OOT55_13570 [Marinimicrobium sp. C6131]